MKQVVQSVKALRQTDGVNSVISEYWLEAPTEDNEKKKAKFVKGIQLRYYCKKLLLKVSMCFSKFDGTSALALVIVPSMERITVLYDSGLDSDSSYAAVDVIRNGA